MVSRGVGVVVVVVGRGVEGWWARVAGAELGLVERHNGPHTLSPSGSDGRGYFGARSR